MPAGGRESSRAKKKPAHGFGIAQPKRTESVEPMWGRGAKPPLPGVKKGRYSMSPLRNARMKQRKETDRYRSLLDALKGMKEA